MEALRLAATALAPTASSDGAPAREASPGAGFAELVQQVLERANRDQLHAEAQSRQLAAGQGDVVETMLALNRADLSLRFVVSLRNRVLDAYQEIMRLQV